MTATQSHTQHILTTDCGDPSYILEPVGDSLLCNDSYAATGSYTGKITEYNLKNGVKRVFNVLVSKSVPNFLAVQPLTDGAIRVAYTLSGDCDPDSSDYVQPGNPASDFNPGYTPNSSSVCSITIPAAPK